MRLIAGIFCNIKKINDSLLLSPGSRTTFIGNRAASISSQKKIPSVGGPQAGGLEPRTGLEPVTYALRMRRSTN